MLSSRLGQSLWDMHTQLLTQPVTVIVCHSYDWMTHSSLLWFGEIKKHIFALFVCAQYLFLQHRWERRFHIRTTFFYSRAPLTFVYQQRIFCSPRKRSLDSRWKSQTELIICWLHPEIVLFVMYSNFYSSRLKASTTIKIKNQHLESITGIFSWFLGCSGKSCVTSAFVLC